MVIDGLLFAYSLALLLTYLAAIANPWARLWERLGGACGVGIMATIVVVGERGQLPEALYWLLAATELGIAIWLWISFARRLRRSRGIRAHPHVHEPREGMRWHRSVTSGALQTRK